MQINEFIEELSNLSININSDQLNQLEQYYELLIEWNKVMNLTGITGKEEVYLKHFYDSLTLSKVTDFKKINTFCDIGTGAGFPGMIIKIIFPHIHVTLVDSLQKRINFLKIVTEKLNLKDIEIVHARAEEYGIRTREKFDIVTARAVASLSMLLEFCIPLVKENGSFIAMKANISDELNYSNKAINILNCQLVQNENFLLPKENSNRTLLRFLKLKKTENKYPRKFSEIKNNPL